MVRVAWSAADSDKVQVHSLSHEPPKIPASIAIRFSRFFQQLSKTRQSPVIRARFTEDLDPPDCERRLRDPSPLLRGWFRACSEETMSVTARERMRRRATTLALVAAILASARGARAVPAVCTEARLEGLPTLCRPDTVQTGPNVTTTACCDELRELNDARCFCSEPFLGLDATRQGALVPALATAPRRCGVETRVGRACRSVAGDDGAEATPPRVGDETREDGAAATCPTSTLIRLVQDGCAGALTETCCDAIAALNARSCFCEDDVVDVLRSFPASFRRMFASTRDACGFVVRGGRRCEPFPVSKRPAPPAPFPPYPPYPPYPPTPPTPPTVPTSMGPTKGPTRGPNGVDVVRVCDPAAFISLLDVQRCDVTLLVTAPDDDDGTALDACCESIGLLNQPLCLCDPNIASLVAQTRFASTPMLESVHESCGFRVSALDSNGTCSEVVEPVKLGPPPNLRGRPPRPSRPPVPSPPVPRAPRGPPGPPGPPGRTVVLAGAGRVPGSAKDSPLYFVSKCPPWVRRCGYTYDWEDWEEEEDAVFPTDPPALMIDYGEYFDG